MAFLKMEKLRSSEQYEEKHIQLFKWNYWLACAQFVHFYRIYKIEKKSNIIIIRERFLPPEIDFRGMSRLLREPIFLTRLMNRVSQAFIFNASN